MSHALTLSYEIQNEIFPNSFDIIDARSNNLNRINRECDAIIIDTYIEKKR